MFWPRVEVSYSCFFHILVFFTAAVSYLVEADGGRRKLGQPSRVMFLNKSRSETDYYFNGTLDLRGQNQETCIKLKAKLKVKHIDHSVKLHLQDLMHSVRNNFSSFCFCSAFSWNTEKKNIHIQSWKTVCGHPMDL